MTPQTQVSQFSDQTSLASIQATQEAARIQPEDLRSDRYGYNPGWPNMTMAAHQSGLQTGRVEPGTLTLFRSFGKAQQNWSVDPGDPDPRRSVMGELLAGHQVHNLLNWYKDLGFREFEALRGIDRPKAIDVFETVHPTLEAAVEAGIIAPCLYRTENVFEVKDPQGHVIGQRHVCVACRLALLKAFEAQENGLYALARKELRGSIQVAEKSMKGAWGQAVGELATRANNMAGDKGAISELTPDNLAIMRQIHMLTPTDAELTKVNAANNALREAVSDIGRQMAEAAASKNDDQIAELKAMVLQQREDFANQVAMLQAARQPAQKAPAKETKSKTE